MDTAHTNDLNRSPQTPHYETLRELGDCYTSVGDFDQAQDCYEKAASLGPDEPGPYIGLGVAALQTQRLEDAEIAFRVAHRLDPKCAKACTGLAMVAQQRRDLPRAFDFYLKSLDLDADNIMALLGLFQVSCDMGSFARITRYLEAYLGMHPDDTAVMFALAALYLKDGRLDSSRTTLLRLLAREPGNRDAANLLEEVEHARAGARPGGAAPGPVEAP
ncbi:MAG: tetratricopeptide repeat protein [Planctomycetes bacterium]|jgi:tetratricopeptide (TPR) repeat protein|nr:tetratricopeptide repeat protein [Planctomycetota bacterium]